jgi:hypothetical protein
VLGRAESAAETGPVIPSKPTHVVIASVDMYAKAEASGAVVTQLPPGTQVRLVETKDGWTLIARDGIALGYIDEKYLLALH